jgi:Flp pilus assembly protein protease CpaA
MQVMLILTSLFIVYQDIRDHIISNRALLVLAIPLLVMHEEMQFALSLFATLALLLLAVPTNLGGGDIKLLLLLFWSSAHSIFSSRFLSMLLLILFIQLIRLLVVRVASGLRDTHIPLAPALLLPIIVIHLGI